jgi:prepilin-type N-terminal cleavage/methylation domain-containing protein
MSRARGFTLIEVLVALTITGLVVIAAHRIFTGVADGASSLSTTRERLDRTTNARRWLKATFLSLVPPFDGQVDRVTFSAWQQVSGGWFEQRSIELRQQANQFVAAGRPPLILADSVASVTFDYLLEPGADTKWVREWISPVSAPLAIRVRIAGCNRGQATCVDTLLFLIKERG